MTEFVIVCVCVCVCVVIMKSKNDGGPEQTDDCKKVNRLRFQRNRPEGGVNLCV